MTATQPLHESSGASQSGGRNPPDREAGFVPLVGGGIAGLTEAEAAAFTERAAIREFDGGFPRQVAERLAWLDVVRLRTTAGPQFVEQYAQARASDAGGNSAPQRKAA